MRRYFLFILGIIFFANLVSWFTLNELLGWLNAPHYFRWSIDLFLPLQTLGLVTIVGARLLGHQPGTGLGRPLLSLFMIWNLLLALPTAVASLVWVAGWCLIDGAAEPSLAARTAGLLAVALPFVVAFFATGIALWQLGRFRINRIVLTIPHLPRALLGLTIVHLSDLHLGKLTQGKVLDDIVTATNRFDADVIVFTGDLINFALSDLPAALAVLRRLKSRHGLFICEGNHDLIESRAEFELALRKSGLNFLLNERAGFTVNGQVVDVVGLGWGDEPQRQRGGTSSPSSDARSALLDQRGTNDFTIVLAHHPDAFDAAAEAGLPLTLAGHTHGGQLMLTRTRGFGPWLFRYWSGVYNRGNSQLIVSNGVGNWFPLRLNAPAEIVHITLQ